MPRYRRHSESQPNPKAETVRAYPRVHIRTCPRSPRTPTAQDYKDSPGPTTANSPHDPTTPTHAHSSAPGHGPAHGQWWQRWTHTQLWEMRKWARAEPSLEGLVHRPRKGSAEKCRRQPAGGWMTKAAWEAMLPMRSTPMESTPASSPHPRTTRMSTDACGRPSRRCEEKAGASGTSPEAQPHPHHPTSVDAQTPAAPTAPREPRAPHSTTRLSPGPAAPPPNPATQPATAAERHAEPYPEETERTGSRWTRARTPTGTATPSGAEPKPAAVKTA